jgi:hypothetical protein
VGQENSDQPCLFGWPAMPWKGMRGRPPHVPCEKSVNKVKMLLAFGWANSRIANALGISEPTLRRHYFSVLKVRAIARDALDARRAELLWAQVEKGNVGAMKAFDRILSENDIMTRARRLRDDEVEDDEEAPVQKRSGYIGKKGLATDAAQAALAIDPDLQPGRSTKAH